MTSVSDKESLWTLETASDETRERRVLRKIDWYLLPFVSLLYLLCFLDRANIGNAKVAGLVTDLSLDGYKYNICVAVFFLTYSAGEIPSNIALKFLRPSIWIPSIMVAWGVVMTLMVLVKSYEGLLVARLFLGLAESGLFVGITYYISMWYARKEQSRRVAIFLSAATVAGAFGGILAYCIQKMDGIAGLHGWAWIFCLEGILTVLVGFMAYFVMYDYPDTAKFLTEEERQFVMERLRKDRASLATHYDGKFVWQALIDWKTYLQVIILLGLAIPSYSMSLFMPTIIAGLGGHTPAETQLLTVPPYIAGCICTVLIGILSDKYQIRGFVIQSCIAVAIAGYSVLYTAESSGVGYVGTVIAAMGVYSSIPVGISWAANNAGGDLKRGVALAIVIGTANLGAICSSFIYRSVDSPRYRLGHIVVMGSLLLSFIGSGVAIVTYTRLNKQKEALCSQNNITESREAEFGEMGDESPLFRYAI